MSTLRKADFFYPGFEHAGLETVFDRALTEFFCFVASACVAVKNAATRLSGVGAPSYHAPLFEA